MVKKRPSFLSGNFSVKIDGTIRQLRPTSAFAESASNQLFPRVQSVVSLKTRIKRGLVSALPLILCPSANAEASSKTPAVAVRRPNVVIIYMDDLGWKDIVCAGSTYYETPNIDRLAANGMRFTRAYSAAPLCAPSRGALITGKAPARLKYTTVCGAGSSKDDSLYPQTKQFGIHNQNLEAPMRHALGSTEVTFAQRLQAAGYRTEFLGKWHCGTEEGYRPEQRGYDVAKGYFQFKDGSCYPHYLDKESLGDLVGLPDAKEGNWLADLLTDEACRFIQENRDRPFLLHLCHYLVHGPVTAKKELLEKYQNKPGTDQSNPKYATMVEAMDDSVGRIMRTLEESGLLENTLVLFISDNGGLTLDRRTSNYPLMGGKSFSYEGAYRVPLIAHWPARIKPGQINGTRTVGMDIYPTILEACGLEPDFTQHVDGLSLMGELTGSAKLKDRPLYFHFPHYTHATSPYSIIIDKGMKLIRYYNDAKGRFALFDLNKDEEEQMDLSSVLPETVQSLDAKLQTFLTESGACMPIPINSPEGKELVQLFNEKKLKGFSSHYLEEEDYITNKQTEREWALKERRQFEAMLKPPISTTP